MWAGDLRFKHPHHPPTYYVAMSMCAMKSTWNPAGWIDGSNKQRRHTYISMHMSVICTCRCMLHLHSWFAFASAFTFMVYIFIHIHMYVTLAFMFIIYICDLQYMYVHDTCFSTSAYVHAYFHMYLCNDTSK